MGAVRSSRMWASCVTQAIRLTPGILSVGTTDSSLAPMRFLSQHVGVGHAAVLGSTRVLYFFDMGVNVMAEHWYDDYFDCPDEEIHERILDIAFQAANEEDNEAELEQERRVEEMVDQALAQIDDEAIAELERKRYDRFS
jgi:hypothetical protein